jgi:hypothetical protein
MRQCPGRSTTLSRWVWKKKKTKKKTLSFTCVLLFLYLDQIAHRSLPLQAILLSLGSVIFIGVNNPWVLLGLATVFTSIAGLKHHFTKFSLPLKRLESASRSPLFSHLSATLAGLSSIRIHNAEDDFVSKMNALIDSFGTIAISNVGCDRWFSLRVTTLANCFLGLVVLLSLYLRSDLGTGVVALSIAYTISWIGLVQYASFKVSFVVPYLGSPLQHALHCSSLSCRTRSSLSSASWNFVVSRARRVWLQSTNRLTRKLAQHGRNTAQLK